MQPLHLVLFRRVIFVAMRNRVPIHFQRREKLKHLLDLLHLRFLVHRGVRCHLVSKKLRHPNGLHAFLEDSLALHNQVMRIFQAINVDIPVHPFCRLDRGPAIILALPNRFNVLIRNQFSREQLRKGRFQRGRVNARQIILHFLAHEHAVGADINNAPLFEQTSHQLFNLRIDQRLPATN